MKPKTATRAPLTAARTAPVRAKAAVRPPQPAPEPEAPAIAAEPDDSPGMLLPSLPGWIAPKNEPNDIMARIRATEAAVGGIIGELSIGPAHARLAEEERRITRRLAELRRLNETSNVRREAARERDLEAAAAALRQNKPDLGDVHQAEHDRQDSANRREAEVLVRQRAAVRRDIAALTSSPDLADEVHARIASEIAASTSDLESYARHREAIASLRTIARWVADRGGKPLSPPPNPTVPGLGVPLWDVLGALAAIDAPAAPPKPAMSPESRAIADTLAHNVRPPR